MLWERGIGPGQLVAPVAVGHSLQRPAPKVEATEERRAWMEHGVSLIRMRYGGHDCGFVRSRPEDSVLRILQECCATCPSLAYRESGALVCRRCQTCAHDDRPLADLVCDADKGCPDHRWYPSIRVRHLLYHVYAAKANDGWRENLDALAEHWGAFNGRRIIAIASGPNTHPPECVEVMLPGDAEIIHVTNDRRLRETATLPLLLRAIATTASDNAMCYAHTKGNTTAESVEGATRWRDAMYAHVMGRADEACEALERYPCVGTTIMQWAPGEKPPYPSGLKTRSPWMFAGTFWWARCDALFRQRWDDVPNDRYGAEAYLSGHFRADQAYSLFQPWPREERPINGPYWPGHYPG